MLFCKWVVEILGSPNLIDMDKEYQSVWNDIQKEMAMNLYELYEKVPKVN